MARSMNSIRTAATPSHSASASTTTARPLARRVCARTKPATDRRTNCFYNQKMRVSWLRWCFLLLVTTRLAHADGGPAFDLDGPRIRPRSRVMARRCPSVQWHRWLPGDRVWVHPDLPEKEGARYVLVVAFLRGSVNPPPENWFTKAETWNKKIREEGIYVTVPEGAQQVLLFLAPETGGDFSTVRNAVRGRPGAFVRASQDLHQASLDRARLDTYLAAVKTADSGDPKAGGGADEASGAQPQYQGRSAVFRQAYRTAGAVPGAEP
jgi:hypothetical protein